jgi:hypothetical protein
MMQSRLVCIPMYLAEEEEEEEEEVLAWCVIVCATWCE